MADGPVLPGCRGVRAPRAAASVPAHRGVAIAVASTVALFGTGVALLALDQREGTIVGLHKASFLVWLGALGIHVLVRVIRLPGALRARLPGASLRIAAAAVALVAGGALATLTFPAADRLQDAASEHIGFDAS